MQVIIPRDEEEVGHFEWELPDALATAIEMLPPQDQQKFRDDVALIMRGILHFILGSAYMMPTRGNVGFRVISKHLANLAADMNKFAR